MRKEAFDMDKLQYYALIHKVVADRAGLTQGDLNLLIQLKPMGLFTMKDYKLGKMTLAWNNNRWNELTKNGWIVKMANLRGPEGHNKYRVSAKGRQTISRIAGHIDGRPIAEYKNPKRHYQKMLQNQIRKFNSIILTK